MSQVTLSLTAESNSQLSFQSSQVVLNEMGQSLHFRVPACAPGNGSVSTKGTPQSQLQLEFGLPLLVVSVHVVAIVNFGQEWCFASCMHSCIHVSLFT